MGSEGATIRKFLNFQRQEKWGWVIFRCTYTDDAAWENFLRLLRADMKAELDFSGDRDMLDTLDLVIIEDKDTLDNADIPEVRRRFAEWVEQSGLKPNPHLTPCNVRSTFCLMVDAESLASLPAGPPTPNRIVLMKSWVNLIHAFANEEDEEESGVYMRAAVSGLGVRAYTMLTALDWTDSYRRPPQVAVL